MKDKEFYNHISQYIDLDIARFSEISDFFEEVKVGKKKLVYEPSEKCNKIFYTAKGCLNLYFIDDRGMERTIQFSIENWWIGDFLAFYNQSPTNFYIKSIEASKLLSITYDNYEKLLQKYPKLESYFRQTYQIAYGAFQFRMMHMFKFSKEELYFCFTDHFPSFAERVPQYLIASYLGLTPEYVSEIRAKIRS